MWRQLCALFGGTPPPPRPEDVHESPAEFGLTAAPEWVLEWSGWILPRGRGYRGRLLLGDGAAPASAAVEYPVNRTRPAHPRSIRLSESVERCLRAVLRVAFPEGLLSVPEGCLDGFPFEVVVHRREPYRGVRAWCNLGDGLEVLGPSGEHPGRSLSELAETAVEAGSPLNPVFRIGFALLEVSLAGAEAEQSAAADRGRITVQRSSRFLGGPGC